LRKAAKGRDTNIFRQMIFFLCRRKVKVSAFSKIEMSSLCLAYWRVFHESGGIAYIVAPSVM